MRAYKRAMNTVGVAAGLVTVAYLVAVALAAADGSQGIEVPPRLAGIAIAAIVVLSVFASGAWLIDRANRFAVEVYVRPAIRTELECLRPELVEALAEDVAARLAQQRECDMRRVAQSVATLAVAGVRAAVADVIDESTQNVFATGRRNGIVMEAQDRRYAMTGTDHGISGPPAKSTGRATVHHLPRQADRDTEI